MLTFYFAPRSSSMAAHIALHEIGVPFEARPLSLPRRDNRAADYLAINPEGKVPTLLVEGRPLTEVAAILFYLARRYPEAALLPQDSESEAQVVSWMSFLASTAHPAWRGGGADALTIYTIAEARIEADGWAVGDHFSIADIHLFRLFWRFQASADLPRGDFPRLFAHHDRMLARTAVRKTLEIEAALV